MPRAPRQGRDGDPDPGSDSPVARFVAARRAAGLAAWRQAQQAAQTFWARVHRAGGWAELTRAQQVAAARQAPVFASWLMVTGRLIVSADVLTRVHLPLGTSARDAWPEAYRWFVTMAERLGHRPANTMRQWAALAKITACTGTAPDAIGPAEFARARPAILEAFRTRRSPNAGRNVGAAFYQLQLTLFHAGRLDSYVRPQTRVPVSVRGWAVVAPGITEVARRYIAQVALSLRPSTVAHIEYHLREFGTWLAAHQPEVARCTDLDRSHIERFKTWLAGRRGQRSGQPLSRPCIKTRLINLRSFFDRIAEWGYPDAPQRPLLFAGDLPIVDKPLPRFLDDGAAAKLLRASRADADPLARVIVELLARTGMRLGELQALTVDAVVQIGSAYWLRIPLGKLHNDRYIPLHPQLKELLDDWIVHHRPTGVRSDRLLLARHRPLTARRIAIALHRLGAEAGIGRVTPHQLRHTLATQAINRGMSLDAIAALLGHKTLAMTMVYARIADKTVADEYFKVTEKVEALYQQPRQLPATAEGSEMRRLRAEMHRRMLGNGYCARPVEMDCHFESICESCTFFVTTLEFRPTLQKQRDDAERKGQVARQKIFDGLLTRLDDQPAG